VKFLSNFAVAKNKVNVVANKLPNQIIVYTCSLIDIWTRQRERTSMHINAHQCASMPSTQIRGLPTKLAPKVFNLTIKVFNLTVDTPSSPESA
jgi:hypothetical protein